jgi:hypothetical protein
LLKTGTVWLGYGRECQRGTLTIRAELGIEEWSRSLPQEDIEAIRM